MAMNEPLILSRGDTKSQRELKALCEYTFSKEIFLDSVRNCNKVKGSDPVFTEFLKEIESLPLNFVMIIERHLNEFCLKSQINLNDFPEPLIQEMTQLIKLWNKQADYIVLYIKNLKNTEYYKDFLKLRNIIEEITLLAMHPKIEAEFIDILEFLHKKIENADLKKLNKDEMNIIINMIFVIHSIFSTKKDYYSPNLIAKISSLFEVTKNYLLMLFADIANKLSDLSKYSKETENKEVEEFLNFFSDSFMGRTEPTVTTETRPIYLLLKLNPDESTISKIIDLLLSILNNESFQQKMIFDALKNFKYSMIFTAIGKFFEKVVSSISDLNREKILLHCLSWIKPSEKKLSDHGWDKLRFSVPILSSLLSILKLDELKTSTKEILMDYALSTLKKPLEFYGLSLDTITLDNLTASYTILFTLNPSKKHMESLTSLLLPWVGKIILPKSLLTLPLTLQGSTGFLKSILDRLLSTLQSQKSGTEPPHHLIKQLQEIPIHESILKNIIQITNFLIKNYSHAMGCYHINSINIRLIFSTLSRMSPQHVGACRSIDKKSINQIVNFILKLLKENPRFQPCEIIFLVKILRNFSSDQKIIFETEIILFNLLNHNHLSELGDTTFSIIETLCHTEQGLSYIKTKFFQRLNHILETKEQLFHTEKIIAIKACFQLQPYGFTVDLSKIMLSVIEELNRPYKHFLSESCFNDVAKLIPTLPQTIESLTLMLNNYSQNPPSEHYHILPMWSLLFNLRPFDEILKDQCTKFVNKLQIGVKNVKYSI